jgi:hypothetical protein
MKKILNQFLGWLPKYLGVVFLFFFWPIILIIIGTKALFSKKSTDSEKITGAKMVLLIIAILVFIPLGVMYLEPIGLYFDNYISKPLFIIILIILVILTILQKLFPNAKWLNKSIENRPQEKKIDTYEFPTYGEEKAKIIIGHSDTDKADIYWKDIVASKNNTGGYYNDNGNELRIESDPPYEAQYEVCPKCEGYVNQFLYVDKKDGDVDWMEVCFKCKKILYFDLDPTKYEIQRNMNKLSFDNKNNINDVLTNKQIINFLHYIKTNNIHEGLGDDDEDYNIYKLLDRNIPLKEIFKKGEDGYGYSLKALELGEGGDCLVVFEWQSSGGGNGYLWRLVFDGKDNIEKCLLEDMWIDN